MTEAELAPLCPCGGICAEKRRPGNLPPLAVCLRCGFIVGVWEPLLARLVAERQVEREQAEFRERVRG